MTPSWSLQIFVKPLPVGMGPGLASRPGTTVVDVARPNAIPRNTFPPPSSAPKSPSPYFPYIEIPRLFVLNVSSQPLR